MTLIKDRLVNQEKGEHVLLSLLRPQVNRLLFSLLEISFSLIYVTITRE